MADDITRVGDLDKFFGRAPAWHRKGFVMDEDKTAREALEIIGGGFDVTLQMLITENGLALPERAIVRAPIADDPTERSFGVVGPEYQLITVRDAITIWDEHVARPVETMGMLGKWGQEFFITTKLPTIGVKGEEVDNYLLGHFPMSPFKSAQALVSPVVTVCRNTLRLAEEMALQRLRVVHDRTAKQRMATWMSDMVARAEQQTEALKEAFDVLAAHRVTQDEQAAVLEAAYIMPDPPRQNAPQHVLDARFKTYEYGKSATERARAQVVALFDGQATGWDQDARKGTMWGLYNAITERENYRRGGDEQSSAMAILFPTTTNARGAVMERGFDAALRIARN